MIIGIHHTALSVPDLEAARGFYCDVLGFEPIFESGWPQGRAGTNAIMDMPDSAARLCMLKAGNVYIELFEFSHPEPQAQSPNRPVCDHGITHICLQVKDIDTEYARLSAAGMRFHCEPQNLGSSRVTYGRDPFGNVIELLELDDASPMLLPAS